MWQSQHEHFAKVRLCLAPRQPANGNARRISSHHLLGALSPQVEIKTALDDTEQVLAFRVFVGGNASIEPPDRPFHGLFHPFVVGRRGDDDVVELHDDIRAD